MSQKMEIDLDLGAGESQPRFLDRTALEQELKEKYPNRPQNHSKTLPFHTLFHDLFNPLSQNRKNPTGLAATRKRLGPNSGVASANPAEIKRAIIERFISRWRQLVGDDIYPAFRLIVPDKDRERAMYGLKEKALGKNLVKIMKIDRNSEDGFNLLNWKLPGQNSQARMAGDFAGRCFEVLQKRPFIVEVGSMTIGEVNDKLDQLAAAPKEENQLPILEEFYKRMNPEELMWLIRIILRQMKIGATERSIFNIWHPDAESLFNVSSSLRRVCWELHNPAFRLDGEERGVTLMQCFQPQLAQFQIQSFAKMVEKMRMTEEDQEFWIEEKLDGERMQLHMMTDNSIAGGKRFGFWSRKAKDYKHLYGEGLEDPQGSLTRYLKDAFNKGVENIILDGEMIAWDPEQDAAIPFGHLKTAALAENRNPFAGKERPLFRVFDVLYLNDQPLTRYTLRDRRKALEKSMIPQHRRVELHTYAVGTKVEDIEPMLRDVVARGDEGLVLKNPRSMYRLNDRNDDWMKVKPEYMNEFGESLDCLIIGGYYGTGHRGGKLSSFLCGLRVDESFAKKGEHNPQKFYSFFRVGGGFTANDYANIRHATEGKWHEWKSNKPPTEYIELGGGDLQYERPDVWIRPEDSVVVEAKAASVSTSEQYRCGLTLRFPRFRRLRGDKDWKTALSIHEFHEVKADAELKHKEAAMEVEQRRKKKPKLEDRKKGKIVAGYAEKSINDPTFEGPSSDVFRGLTFYVMTESLEPEKKSKPELEVMIKANGGKVINRYTVSEPPICIAERRTVHVASLEKKSTINIVRPMWLFDSIKQSKTDISRGLPGCALPMELDRHFFYVIPNERSKYEDNVDEFGDSYARDTVAEELNRVMERMGRVKSAPKERQPTSLIQNLGEMRCWLFSGTTIFFDPDRPHQANSSGANSSSSSSSFPETSILPAQLARAVTIARFTGATLMEDIQKESISHIIVHGNSDLGRIRRLISKRAKIPRLVTVEWIEHSWREGTLLDEERFAPPRGS